MAAAGSDVAHCFLLLVLQPPTPTLFPYTTLFRSEVQAALPLALHHLTVAAHVQPSAVGIARDDRIAGADVLSAVPRPVARGGAVTDVPLVVAQVVLVHGRALALHDHGRDRVGELCPASADQLHDGEPRGLADRQGEPVHARAQRVPERAETARRALDPLVEHGRRADRPVGYVGG